MATGGHFGTTSNDDGLIGFSDSSAKSGIFGKNDSTASASAPGGSGVFGLTVALNAAGVFGANNGAKGVGVQGNGPEAGVSGFSKQGAGVIGRSSKNGVVGQTNSNTDAGVNGRNDGSGFGVFGGSLNGSGVEGHSANGNGVVGFSEHGLAGRFIGDVEVTGDIRLANADCAEDFDVFGTVKVEPGTVMVLGNEGALLESYQAYDKRVAGVISGAGDYKPGIVLDKRETTGNRQPIALMGKVFCKVDAQFGAIEVGDLLTTSPTPGHAMKVDDPVKSLGAMIGKALSPLKEGRGLIPILIALQ